MLFFRLLSTPKAVKTRVLLAVKLVRLLLIDDAKRLGLSLSNSCFLLHLITLFLVDLQLKVGEDALDTVFPCSLETDLKSGLLSFGHDNKSSVISGGMYFLSFILLLDLISCLHRRWRDIWVVFGLLHVTVFFVAVDWLLAERIVKIFNCG